jgi:hypothetical protein
VTTGELLEAAQGVPWIATGLLVLGAVGVLVERVTGLVGPATKVATWWADREVRELRREARLRAERRRLDREEEEGRLAALRAEVEWLRQEVHRLHALVRCTCVDTSPMRAAVHPSQPVPLPRAAKRPATHRAP